MKKMKTIKTTITILLLSAVILITACATSKKTTTAGVLLWDVTDDFVLKPSAQDVLRLYDFDRDQWNGGEFRFSDITHVSFNDVKQTSIEPENELLSNRFQREKKLKKFQKEVTDILAQAMQTTLGRDNSSVYYPMAEELNRLSKSSADKKYFFVYSDLMENSMNVSFYKKDKLNILTTNPEEVINILESEVKLQPLGGITIFFLFEPNDAIQDTQYKITSKFFKQFFESKGAQVEISTSINL